MKVTCNCNREFTAKLADCPEDKEGCCVAHYDKGSFICPYCKYDSGPDIGHLFASGHVTTSLGVGVVNMNAISKLKLTE